MAVRDPSRPQLDFPELVAELITQLRLRGQVGILDFSDQVIPTFLIGSRGINFSGDLPAFSSAAIFSNAVTDAPANTVVGDTGGLPAGTYDVMAWMSLFGTVAAGGEIAQLQHRNAADTVTLAVLLNLGVTTTDHTVDAFLPLMGYVLGLNERIRAISPAQALIGSVMSTNIFAQIRPTP